MQQITAFVDTDGIIHRTVGECALADEHIAARRAIASYFDKCMEPLGPRPDELRFSNGDGYIQHDPKVILAVVRKMRDLTVQAEPGSSERFANTPDNTAAIVNTGTFWTGRLNEGSPLTKYWTRMWCIDSRGREYGQPYYALNPDKAPTNCLSDRTS